MFKLAQSESFFWPVQVKIPASGGKFETHTFDAEFKRLTQSRNEELGTLIQEDKISPREAVKEIVIGWKGVVDEHGQEMPFSEGALDRLIDVPNVGSAVLQAYTQAVSGAKTKN